MSEKICRLPTKREVRVARRAAQEIHARWNRDVRRGKINSIYPEEMDEYALKRQAEAELISCRYSEIEAMFERRHESYLNMRAYRKTSDKIDHEKIMDLLEDYGFNYWKLGAYFRKLQDDGKGVYSKYSVLGEEEFIWTYDEMQLQMAEIIETASDMGAVYCGSYLAEDRDFEVELGVPQDTDLSKITVIMRKLKEDFGGEIVNTVYNDSSIPPKSEATLRVVL